MADEGLTLDLGEGMLVAIVDISELEYLQKNARYMTHGMFSNLVENIKNDGRLSQLPFCLKTSEGKYRILSGNNRCRAAIAAGLTKLPILYTTKLMTEAEQIAVQLSHNSISGQDNTTVLKELYDSIDELSLKYYAGLDDKTLNELSDTTLSAMTEANLEYSMLTFLFLPEEAERLNKIIKEAAKCISTDTIISRMQEHERLLVALFNTKTAYNVRNGAAAMMIILDLFESHIDELQKGWLDSCAQLKHNTRVPLASVIGTETIPAKLALKIKISIDAMINKGKINKSEAWKILEFINIS